MIEEIKTTYPEKGSFSIISDFVALCTLLGHQKVIDGYPDLSLNFRKLGIFARRDDVPLVFLPFFPLPLFIFP